MRPGMVPVLYTIYTYKYGKLHRIQVDQCVQGVPWRRSSLAKAKCFKKFSKARLTISVLHLLENVLCEFIYSIVFTLRGGLPL